MTTLQQAAQELGKELFGPELQDDDVNIILKNLAPVQTELDRLKKEMEEAREMLSRLKHDVRLFHEGCYDHCDACKAQSWLERNK
jgi:hypothetical protein